MANLLTTTPVKSSPAALLKIVGLNLLIMQRDIRTIESVSDVDGAEPEPGSVGWISVAKERWPVYCLSDDLVLLTTIPPERGTCVMLALDGAHIGILSDDVSILNQIPTDRFELPSCMALLGTPVEHVLKFGDEIICVTNAHLLAEHIDSQINS
jgi:hypothetical protein